MPRLRKFQMAQSHTKKDRSWGYSGTHVLIASHPYYRASEVCPATSVAEDKQVTHVQSSGDTSDLCHEIMKTSKPWLRTGAPTVIVIPGTMDLTPHKLKKMATNQQYKEANQQHLAKQLAMAIAKPLKRISSFITLMGGRLWVAYPPPRLGNLDHPKPIPAILQKALLLARRYIRILNKSNHLPPLPLPRELVKGSFLPPPAPLVIDPSKFLPNRRDLKKEVKVNLSHLLNSYLERFWTTLRYTSSPEIPLPNQQSSGKRRLHSVVVKSMEISNPSGGESSYPAAIPRDSDNVSMIM